MEINKNQPAIKGFINEEAQMKREIIDFFFTPSSLSLIIFLSKGSSLHTGLSPTIMALKIVAKNYLVYTHIATHMEKVWIPLL